MDRLVTVVVLGHEIPVLVKNAATDEAAREAAIEKAAHSFHVRAITAVKPPKPIWDLMKDGFHVKRSLLNSPIPQ